MQKSRYLYNARIFLHIFLHLFITYIFINQFNFTQLTSYLVKWRSIKVSVRFSLINSLRYLTFSSVRAVFGRSLSGFRSVAEPRSSIPFTDCFHWAKLPTLYRKFCNICSVSKTKFPQCIDPSLRFRQFDIYQVNTAQSNALVHSNVPNERAKFGAKIFRHFWDIAIFVLRYFILPHPVQRCVCAAKFRVC